MQVREGGISIWFFIGISLLVNGALILAAGLYQLVSPPPPANRVVLFNLHANAWWGALLLIVGLFYCVHFRPARTTHP
jgi:uncharacterized membrane protein HdeD (DUF308 family)